MMADIQHCYEARTTYDQSFFVIAKSFAEAGMKAENMAEKNSPIKSITLLGVAI